MTDGLYHSKQFEAAVLGICMLERDAFGRLSGLIDEQTFYLEDNRKVFAVLQEMFENNLPIDLLTVWERMLSKKIKLLSGNIAWYLTHLTQNVVNSAHLEYHCHLLKKMWRKRELTKITHSGIDPHSDERVRAIEIQNQIQEILGSEIKREWFSADELMYELLLHQEQIKKGNKQFITSAFKAIDKLNGGFAGGQLIILGARPSVGKSALMNLIATTIAKQGKSVGVISLEMNNTEIAARLASIETQTSFSIIYRNLFNDESQREIFYDRVRSRVVPLPLYVSDKTKVDVAEIKSKAIKLKHQRGLSILFVDYLQLVDTPANKNMNREQEVSKISRGLKLLAMEMDIPIVVLCQLNRAVTHRKGNDRFPRLSDLRESGAIEQDADIVLFLHRDWMADVPTDENGNSTEFSAHLIGAKWRNGAQFLLELDFEPGLMKFGEKVGVSGEG